MSDLSPPRKWLIIALEVVERELDGKLLICDEAIKRGWGCIIGTHKEILSSIDSLPIGVVFVKSIQAHELSYLKLLKKKGHKIICLDEEGLVQNDLHFMVTVRSTTETLAEIDAFVLWGKTQCNAYKDAYPQFKEKLHVVGNPRIDLWGKEKYHALAQPTVQKIKAQYGDYIMIPTSFGGYNHMMGRDGALHIYKASNRHSQEHYEFLVGYQNYSKPLYYAFLDIIKPLSERFPNKTIIIRPHPSEDPDPWSKLARDFENVHIAFEGGITPWLLGADAILHCGSTTAVESHLLGRPVISYYPGKNDPKYQLEVPSKISINVNEQSKALDTIETAMQVNDIASHYPEVAAGHAWLTEWADNIDDYESAHKIMDVLEAFPLKKQKYRPEKIRGHLTINITKFKRLVWTALGLVKLIPPLHKRLPFRIQFGLRMQRYNKKKISDIRYDDVQSFMMALQTINQTPNIYISQMRKNIVALTPTIE
jgi:surface carbohydrate biosynthesis protein